MNIISFIFGAACGGTLVLALFVYWFVIDGYVPKDQEVHPE